jgi:hypothetical protein
MPNFNYQKWLSTPNSKNSTNSNVANFEVLNTAGKENKIGAAAISAISAIPANHSNLLTNSCLSVLGFFCLFFPQVGTFSRDFVPMTYFFTSVQMESYENSKNSRISRGNGLNNKNLEEQLSNINPNYRSSLFLINNPINKLSKFTFCYT